MSETDILLSQLHHHLDKNALNEQQRAVVTAPPGSALVIAGAGSGKTRTLIYRVAQLILTGTPVERILVLTFTNQASREVTRRASELLQNQKMDLWSGTFHSVGRKILRANAELIGFKKTFTILDSEDAKIVMNQVKKENELSGITSENILSILSYSINTGVPLEEVIAQKHPIFLDLISEFSPIFHAYKTRKREMNVMDYDDLLFLWKKLFLEHPEIQDLYAKHFLHVFVDEYQDTNLLQAELVTLMASKHKNLMVIGDDCQSIYAFRGAKYENILHFSKQHLRTTIFRLEQNYRSTPEMVAFANASIAKNTLQHKKNLFSKQSNGLRPVIVSCKTESQEANFIVQRIKELVKKNVQTQEIAVLYRAHWMSMLLQTRLHQHKIPYLVRSGIRFFEQRHIKDLLSFLQFSIHQTNELAFLRLITLGKGIGAISARKLFNKIRELGGLTEKNAAEIGNFFQNNALSSWQLLCSILLRLQTAEHKENVELAIKMILKDFYFDYIKRTFSNKNPILADIMKVSVFASQQSNLQDFLDSTTLEHSFFDASFSEKKRTQEGVILSTIHQAKGLEFHTVFLLEVAQDRFPSSKAQTKEEIEEERRLFYVGITRAQQELYITYPITVYEQRFGWLSLQPSIFLLELNQEKPLLFEHWNLLDS